MLFSLLVVVLVAVADSRPAGAQNLGSSPQGGVFGVANSSSRTKLDVTVAVAEALDSQAPPEMQSLVPQGGPQSGGYSSMLAATANYTRTRRRIEVAGSAVTALRYYQQLDRVAGVGHSGALGFTVNLPARTRLEVNQTGNYSPSFFFRSFPGVAPPELGEALPPSQDYRIDQNQAFSYATRATLSAGSARGSRVSFEGTRNKTDFKSDSGATGFQPGQDLVSGRATWSHGVGRTGLLSAEYEYRAGEFGFGGRATEQRVRFGADYSPALSGSRRTMLRFRVSPSAFQIPASATSVAATGTLYRMEGDVAAEYPLSLRWSLGGSYRRSVEYIAVLREPVFNDAASVQIAGLVSRRVDLSASAGYAAGQSALVQQSPRFGTYTGTVRARYSFSRSLATYAEYLYYYYDLRGQAYLAPQLPGVFEQQGVRIGVMLWTRPVGR